jgi:hypothetical protein
MLASSPAAAWCHAGASARPAAAGARCGGGTVAAPPASSARVALRGCQLRLARAPRAAARRVAVSADLRNYDWPQGVGGTCACARAPPVAADAHGCSLESWWRQTRVYFRPRRACAHGCSFCRRFPDDACAALLFDCDGVLADTERDGHRVTFNAAFAAKGLPHSWSVELYGELLKIGGGKERMTKCVGRHSALVSAAWLL